MLGLDLSVKHTLIINIYWVAFAILTSGFIFYGKDKRSRLDVRLDVYDLVLILLCVLSTVLFILILM